MQLKHFEYLFPKKTISRGLETCQYRQFKRMDTSIARLHKQSSTIVTRKLLQESQPQVTFNRCPCISNGYPVTRFGIHLPLHLPQSSYLQSNLVSKCVAHIRKLHCFNGRCHGNTLPLATFIVRQQEDKQAMLLSVVTLVVGLIAASTKTHSAVTLCTQTGISLNTSLY